MLFGVQLRPYAPDGAGAYWDRTLEVARACEESGFDSVWFADHVMFQDVDNLEKSEPILECFTTLAAIAASTHRVRIGALVAGVPYRNPALLAKMCATLDHISHGRSIIGLGAGWHKQEFDAYNWPFGTVRERFEKLEDATQIIHKMLTERPATYRGKHYSIEDAFNDPPALQQPRPPIMIGGSGERVTLRLVAQYADFCNVFGEPEGVARSYAKLREHCESVGRPYDEITRSNHVRVLIARDEQELQQKREQLPDFNGYMGTPEMLIARFREYVAAGSQYCTLVLAEAETLAPVRLFGETVLPELARTRSKAGT